MIKSYVAMNFIKCGLYMDYILKTSLALNIVFCYSIQHDLKDASIIVE